MTREIRSRRAESADRPLYARALRLHHLAPSGLLCFVFLEGAVVLGILLALAELVSWWGVLVLPVTVALMVKFNDLVAGTFAPRPVARETSPERGPVLRPAAMPGSGVRQSFEGYAPVAPTIDESHPAATVPPAAGTPQRAGGFRVAVSTAPARSTAPATMARNTRFGPAVAPLTGQPAAPARGSARPSGFAPVVAHEPAALGYGHVAAPDTLTDGYQSADHQFGESNAASGYSAGYSEPAPVNEHSYVGSAAAGRYSTEAGGHLYGSGENAYTGYSYTTVSTADGPDYASVGAVDGPDYASAGAVDGSDYVSVGAADGHVYGSAASAEDIALASVDASDGHAYAVEGSVADHGYTEDGSVAGHTYGEDGSFAGHTHAEEGSVVAHAYADDGSVVEPAYTSDGSVAGHAYTEDGAASGHSYTDGDPVGGRSYPEDGAAVGHPYNGGDTAAALTHADGVAVGGHPRVGAELGGGQLPGGGRAGHLHGDGGAHLPSADGVGGGYVYGGDGHSYDGQARNAEMAAARFQPRSSGGLDAVEDESRPADNSGPIRRPWADQLDVRQQMARQAAARRYE